MFRLFLTSMLLGGWLAIPCLGKPKMTFFSQLPAHQLEDVFTDTALLQQLKSLDASVVLAITDFHEHRAKTVKLLKDWEIPVTAWLMLPRKDNYWFTAKNHPLALKRYQDFKVWTTQQDLDWHRVSFMVEPDMAELEKMKEADWTGWISTLWQVADGQAYEQAVDAYHTLAKQIVADGYQLETYIYPYMLNEEHKHLQPLIGLIDVHSEREIPLVFTNYIGRNIEKPVQSFIRQHGLFAIGLGSTGGENMLQQRDVPKPLNFHQLEADLQSAYNFTNEMYIFSLEGCYRNGMLPKLAEKEWQKEELVASPIRAYATTSAQGNLPIQLLQHPILVLAVLAGIALLTLAVILRITKRLLGWG